MKNIKLNADPNNPAPFPPYLPLFLFDDEEYESRRPEEWLELGVENGVRKPVPGKSLLPTKDDVQNSKFIPLSIFNHQYSFSTALLTVDPKDPSIEYKWFSIGVLDYDAKHKLWLVQKVNSQNRIVDDKGKPVVNGGVGADGMYFPCQ
jgi:dynein heavy chain